MREKGAAEFQANHSKEFSRYCPVHLLVKVSEVCKFHVRRWLVIDSLQLVIDQLRQFLDELECKLPLHHPHLPC
jgi:hypothetical protein